MEWGHLYASGVGAREIRREYRGADGSEPLAHRDGGLGDLPLTVLVAPAVGPPGFGGISRAIDHAKRDMVRESRRGRLVEVQTGHYIHYEDLDRVVAEILRMIAFVAEDSVREAASGERGP